MLKCLLQENIGIICRQKRERECLNSHPFDHDLSDFVELLHRITKLS